MFCFKLINKTNIWKSGTTKPYQDIMLRVELEKKGYQYDELAASIKTSQTKKTGEDGNDGNDKDQDIVGWWWLLLLFIIYLVVFVVFI